MIPSPSRLARLFGAGLVLLFLTACLEHIEALQTRVQYDPYRQVFKVEQRLVGVEKRFLGCDALEDCVAAVRRAVTLSPDPGVSLALGDRLLQRLLESGAVEVSVQLERDGDKLDAIIRYEAPVGSAAAADTLVRAEWVGKKNRGRYYLVVLAQDSMEPPRFYRTRKVAHSGPSGVDWREEWVLPRWTRKVATRLEVGESEPLFAAVPGLLEALEAEGWLGEVYQAPAVASEDSEASEDTEPAPVSDTRSTVKDGGDSLAEAPAPVRRSQISSVEATSVAIDPNSPAKTWFYPARITGGALTPAVAAVSLEPIAPAISRCYQTRQREIPHLEGSAFLSALVRADGEVVATSVNGALSDPEILACLDKVLESWTFSSWGTGDAVSDVAVPVVFRVEKGGPGKGG